MSDRLILSTPEDRQVFVVDEFRVVDPHEVEVLDPTLSAVLTQVTFYPFYFVGITPQRYVVTAVEVPGDGADDEIL